MQQQQQPGVAAAAAAVASLLQNQGPTVKAAEAAPGAKRIPKKRKLISDVPGKAPQSIPESSLFTTLRKCEDSIDKRLRLKRNEVAAAVQQNPDQGDPKRLRLYIFHTHSHQTPARQQAFDAGTLQPTEEQPSWTLWLSGRLEGPDADAAAAAAAAAAAPTPAQLLEAAIAGGGAVPMPGAVLAPVAPPAAYRHDGPGMTKALKRITITFTPADAPGTTGSAVPSATTTVVWDREHHTGEHVDQLQVKCVGTQPVDARISVEVDWRPARFKLPPVLVQLLGMRWGSRDTVLRTLYAYIQRSSRVQTQGQGQVLVCDEALEGVFGQKVVEMGSVVERVVGMLEAMDPITLEHSIRLDGPSPSPLQHCFDIDVVLPGHPADRGLGAMFDKYSKDKEIETLNHKIDAAIAKIREHKRRHTLFMGFAQSPADFMTSLIASQARDLRIAKPHASTFELQRRTETFSEKWVEDAATKFINRKLGIEF